MVFLVRKKLLLTGLAVTCALGTAACGGGGSGGTVTADVVVGAGPGLKFDQQAYTVTAGSRSIALVQKDTQAHSLKIKGVDGLRLAVTAGDKSAKATVTLQAGTYTLYCDIPGHEQGGMHATLTVT